MHRITVKIDGMMCGMCESHVNEAVRRAFPVKRVASSHRRGETVILSEADLDPDALRAAIDATGYKALSVQSEPCEKKPLFGPKK